MPHGKHTTKALAKAAYRAGIEAQAELEAAASVKTGRTYDGQVVKDVKRAMQNLQPCYIADGSGRENAFCVDNTSNCPPGSQSTTAPSQHETRREIYIGNGSIYLKGTSGVDYQTSQRCSNTTASDRHFPAPRPCNPNVTTYDCMKRPYTGNVAGFPEGTPGIVIDTSSNDWPLPGGIIYIPYQNTTISGSINCPTPSPTPSQSSSSYISSAISTAKTVVPSMMTPVASMVSATPTAAIAAAASLPEVSVIGIAVGSFAGGVVVTLSCLAAYKFGSWLCKPKEIVTVQAIFDQGRDAAPRIHLVRENSRRGDKDRSRPQSTASTEPSPTRSESVNLHGSRSFDPDPPRAPAPLPPDIDEAGYSTVGWLPQLPIHHARRRNDFSTSSEPAVPTQSNYQRPRLATTYQTMNSVSLLSVSQVNTESPAPSPMDVDHMNPLYHSNTPL